MAEIELDPKAVAEAREAWLGEFGTLEDAIRAYLTALHPVSDEAVRVLRQFADMYRSGAQGAEMDYRAAKTLAEAIDAALAHTGKPEWQPIETAPKDGTAVDLWVRPWDAEANGNPARIVDAWYSEGEWMRWIAGWKHRVASCGEPTHWMPRPAAPSALQTGGET